MTVEQLTKVHKAEPFRPYVLHLADGRSIRVPHRDFLISAPSGRTIVVALEDDTFEIIDLLLVTSIAVTPPKRPRRQAP